METLAPQAVVSLGILVRELTRARQTAFIKWSAAFDVLATNIAGTMSRADKLKRLFAAEAGYRNYFLTKHKPPGDGFQQLQIDGFTSTDDGPVLVATILVVIPQDAAIIRASGWPSASSMQRRTPIDPARGSSSS